MEVCGADMNVIHVRMATEHLETWEKLIGNRKSPLASAAVIGFDTLFQLFTRQFTLQALVDRVSERIGIKGRIIIWDKAEPCMDVDKPHQLEIMREALAQEKKKEAAAAKRKTARTSAPRAATPKARPQVKARVKHK
jgi:hypothetical protein